MIYTVTMNPAIDCGYFVPDKIVGGRVNRASSQSVSFGGKGINVSLALAALGAQSIATGFIAGFTGDALAAGLSGSGLSCRFVKLSSGMTRINAKVTSPASSGADPDTEINAPGPSVTDSDIDELSRVLAEAVPGDVVLIAGSLAAGRSADDIKAIASRLPDGVCLALDLSGTALAESLSLRPIFIKPNLHELCGYLGIAESPDGEYRDKIIKLGAERMLAEGAENILVSLGGDGAYFASKSGGAYVTPPKSNVTHRGSAVGCGDSAVAGWLCGSGLAGRRAYQLARSFSPEDAPPEYIAAKFAVTVGSSAFFCSFPPSENDLLGR